MTVCGDGGMVVTNDEEKANVVSKLRNGGKISKYKHDIIGYTSRLNTVNASIGRVQLRKLEKWNEKRRYIVNIYNDKFTGIGDIITPPKDDKDFVSSHYMYVIRTDYRDKLYKFLLDNDIETGIHYPIPIHLQPIYRKMYDYKDGDFPNSELLSETALSLPLFYQLQQEEITYIIETVAEFYEKEI
jgi:dTDP-4-amino-4,6-dideoxygalactose transaminase